LKVTSERRIKQKAIISFLYPLELVRDQQKVISKPALKRRYSPTEAGQTPVLKVRSKL
jgi:hypothetical protein